MLRSSIILAALLCIALAGGAEARPGRGGVAPVIAGPCSGDAYAAQDGCLGAPTNGNVQVANFFTTAPSGHSYTTRPPWYVAGVDYAIGIPAASFPLKDPAVDPLPTGCTYSSGTHRVTCSAVASPTIDGYDFGNSTGGCIRLLFSSNVTGTITIQNSNFLNGANCDTPSGNTDLVNIAGSADILVKNSVLDGHADSFPYNMPALIMNNSTGCTTIQYTKFQRTPARSFQINSTCNLLMQYSWGDGWAYGLTATTNAPTAAGNNTLNFASTPSFITSLQTANDTTNPTVLGSSGKTVSSVTATTVVLSGNASGTGVQSGDVISFGSATHAEMALTDTRNASGGVMPLLTYSYTLFSQPTAANGLETTAELYISNGTTNPTFSNVSVDHNTFLTNRILNDRNLAGFVVNITATIPGTVLFDSNYWDPYGAFGCVTGSGGGTLTYSNNVNMLDSSAVTGAVCNGHN